MRLVPHLLRALLDTFRFVDWWLLPLLFLIPLWAWLRGRVAPVAAVQYSSGELLRGPHRRPRFDRHRCLAAFRYLALALLILALARPQIEKGLSDVQTQGINIMLVLDFSGTMKTKDFTMRGRKVSRSTALRSVISEFMRARRHDRIGLVRFDRDACLVSPLTLDHDYLIARLQAEKDGGGTAPGSGLLIAAEHLLPATNQTKVAILVSDIANLNAGPKPLEVAPLLARLGIRVHLIQLIDFRAMGAQRLAVANTPEALLLNELAEVPGVTGGQLFQVADYAGLRNVYRQIDELEKSSFKEGVQRVYRELMPWFAGAGLLLLLLELALGQTVWRRLP